MVRIGNKEIPQNKNVRVGLTNIYGIGWSTAEKIVNKLGIEIKKRIRDLSETEIKSISEEVKSFSIEGELREKKKKIINEEIRLGTYRSTRWLRKLPVKQRTRHNARTAKAGAAKLKPGEKRKRVAVAGKKKAPTPK